MKTTCRRFGRFDFFKVAPWSVRLLGPLGICDHVITRQPRIFRATFAGRIFVPVFLGESQRQERPAQRLRRPPLEAMPRRSCLVIFLLVCRRLERKAFVPKLPPRLWANTVPAKCHCKFLVDVAGKNYFRVGDIQSPLVDVPGAPAHSAAPVPVVVEYGDRGSCRLGNL